MFVTHLYFLPSALVTLWMGVQFGLGVFLKVGVGDVCVPPVGHSVVEDPVEGRKVVRGGKGGATVIVARCLSPSNRPHLVGIGQSVGSSFSKRLARQRSQLFGLADSQATNQLANFKRLIWGDSPFLVTCFALAGLVRGSQVHVNLFTSPKATTTALAVGGLIGCCWKRQAVINMVHLI